MQVLSVTTNPVSYETTYNGIPEYLLINDLNLKQPVKDDSYESEIVMLTNEREICKHFFNQGYTHINDPQSSLNPYPIDDHIRWIQQHISNYDR